MNPNADPSPTRLEARIAALEARIAELEQQCEVAQLNIPWHVICAAVAAVMPNVRIVRVTHAVPTRDRWQSSGVLQNMHSHQL